MSRTLRLKAAAVAAVALLGGCRQNAATNQWELGIEPSQGRYLGVGIYAPGAAWTRVTRPRAGDVKLGDDQAIIVVTDSRSGEVRACGDLSGYCVAMNPWAKASRRAPIVLAPLPEQKPAHRRRSAFQRQTEPIYPGNHRSFAARS